MWILLEENFLKQQLEELLKYFFFFLSVINVACELLLSPFKTTL